MSDWVDDHPTFSKFTDEQKDELRKLGEGTTTYWVKRPRRFGTIQVPPHVPLTLTDLYYYINYETHKTTSPPSPVEKWVALTCAFIRHSSDHKPCFGDKVVKKGKVVGECGACRVRDWCGELKVHLIENPDSRRFFPGVSSDNPIFMG